MILQGANFKIMKRFDQCILDYGPTARGCYKLDLFFLPALTASCNDQAKGNTAFASLYCWTMAAFILAFMQKKVCMVILCVQKADDPASPAAWENKAGLHESST